MKHQQCTQVEFTNTNLTPGVEHDTEDNMLAPANIDNNEEDKNDSEHLSLPQMSGECPQAKKEMDTEELKQSITDEQQADDDGLAVFRGG